MFDFDFDHDGDFDLMDLVEADIQYGLFENDDKLVLLQEQPKISPMYMTNMQATYKKLEQGYNKIEQILKNSPYSERALFKAYCELADTFEAKFHLLKGKLEKDYHFIVNCAEQFPGNFPELQDYIDTFCDEFDELEDCLSAFDDILEYEYEEGFEDKVEKYSDKKSALEDELSDIEDLKDEIEELDL